MVVLAVLVGIALLACAVVTVIWAARCPDGRRIAIAEALLLGGCDEPRRLVRSRD